jgi:hypothetical protein
MCRVLDQDVPCMVHVPLVDHQCCRNSLSEFYETRYLQHDFGREPILVVFNFLLPVIPTSALEMYLDMLETARV